MTTVPGGVDRNGLPQQPVPSAWTAATPPTTLETARAYLAAGLCVLPAKLEDKRPDVKSWRSFQHRLPTDDELVRWFSRPARLCLICGAVSGNLEMLDFDGGGELWQAWLDNMPDELLTRMVVERSPSGGRHVIYRSVEPVSGNMKLAARSGATLIETRGEGGLFLCSPSPGYELEAGTFESIPTLTSDERDTVLGIAWALNPDSITTAPPEWGRGVAEQTDGGAASSGAVLRNRGTALPLGGLRPGDDYNARGDVREVLVEAGWSLARAGDNEHWRRPGKSSGTSATLKDRVFYVFSSNAVPFAPQRAYGPFSVLTHLRYGGDYNLAAAGLVAQGFGAPGVAVGPKADLAALLTPKPRQKRRMPDVLDPGPIPAELLDVPGFIRSVMSHSLATAPYPNRAMAFCGAMTLQAFLAGRKVRDPGDNRTNIYLLGLANSSAGKDWPRKVNVAVCHAVGLATGVSERWASGEGLQDALILTPNMLFQSDEIDGLLQSINKSRDARHEAAMSTLLTMYSSANSIFSVRRKAGAEVSGIIDQPCLSLFGTAGPKLYYESLSERMLTNGFFARMLVVESGRRSQGQEPGIIDVPADILAIAKWWSEYQPVKGNMADEHPRPTIVPHTDDARAALVQTRRSADAEYAKAETKQDVVGMTVWGRVSEQVRKLALIYACSVDHIEPMIGSAAIEWATALVTHQVKRMLYMAWTHVADNPFHAECLKLAEKLRSAGGELTHQAALKKMKLSAREFHEIVNTMIMRGDVEIDESSHEHGRPTRKIILISEEKETCEKGR